MLITEVMGEDAEVAREGGLWRSLVEHPDFRSMFLPGSQQNREYLDRISNNRSEQRGITVRKKGRAIIAATLMAGSLGLAWYSTTTGLLTIPEPIANQVTGWVSSMSSSVGEQVDFSRDDSLVTSRRPLPGDELFAMLPAPARDEPLPVLLQSGWAAWWSGTDEGLAEARIAFESAAVRAPNDVEALGALVEVYSELVAGDPDLLDPITLALARMSAIDETSIANLRARAADASSSGHSPLVVGIVATCGAPVSELFSTVDLGCAVRLAEARGDDNTLAILYEQSGVMRIALIRARAAVERSDWGVALNISRNLVKEAPGEAEPWAVLALGSAAIGDWYAAASAAREATRRAPHRLDLTHLHARILSRVMGKHKESLPLLTGLVEDPAFDRYEDRIGVLNDAAEAALSLKKIDEGQQWAITALELDPTDPVALLQLAWSYHLQEDTANAEESLRRVDTGQLMGKQGARIHLGAARIYLAMDNQRAAVEEIQNALQGDPGLVEAALEGALADVRVNNLDAAVEKVTRAPLLDVVYTRTHSPIAPTWIPPANWAVLKREIGSALAQDVRYSIRLQEILAIIDWYDQKSSAEASLRTAVQEGGAAGASAALAQQLFENNRPGEALKHIDEVLNIETDNPVFLAMRGFAQATSGDTGAERSLGRALSLEPNNPTVLHWNATALEVLGKKTEALRSREALLIVAPDDVNTQARLISLSEE